MRRALGILLLVGVAACSESFEPASLVENLRVVAARVDIDGKPGRANPDPGDTITVDNLVIDRGYPPDDDGPPPLSPPPLQWSFLACIPEPSVLPLAICGQVLACDGCVATPPADPLALPVVTFTVPSEEELEAADASSVILQGAICANGPPAGPDTILRFFTGETDDLDPCEDPSNEGRFISVEILIEVDPDDPNDNPVIEDVLFNGEAWPPPFDQGVPREFPNVGCSAVVDPEDALRIGGGPPQDVQVVATPESFQTIELDDETVTEEMQVSWLGDGGGFEFSFSFITATEDSPASERTATVLWTPTANPNPGGTLVRFTFPMRDRASPESAPGGNRGGVTWVQRGLCILPPESGSDE